MANVSPSQSRAVDAFKGLITTYKLLPVSTDPKSVGDNYKNSWRTFTNSNGEDLELYYKDNLFLRTLDIVEKLYPGQTDRKLVSRKLRDAMGNWIVSGNDPKDQAQLEEAAKNFLKSVEEKIQLRLVFLPVEGLETNSNSSIQVGNCQLHNNYENSDFMKLIAADRKRNAGLTSGDKDHYQWIKRVKSYFTFEIEAHSGRAIEQGIKETNLSLNILRLYLSSFYFHENSHSVVKRMGLSGTVHIDERSRVFYIDPTKKMEDQYPGGRESRSHNDRFEITPDFVTFMQVHGLERINYLIQSIGKLDPEEEDIARRLLITITWFAKATRAKDRADSYLMYAVAIEGLLSEGRTAQEVYSNQIAALVSCDDDRLIYPMGGYISLDFNKQLERANTVSDRANIIRERTFSLFKYRNRVAHGIVLDEEIEGANLLDFETLINNAILSFVMHNWANFKDFKLWVEKKNSGSAIRFGSPRRYMTRLVSKWLKRA